MVKAPPTISVRKKKQPVSQKRVALVLLSLVVTLTLSAMYLLWAQGPSITSAQPLGLMATYGPGINRLIRTKVPLQAKRWDYIIIYQSGTQAGNAATLAAGERLGGNLPGYADGIGRQQPVNFHFVVDNAHNVLRLPNGRLQRMPDGNLEVGSSWLYQQSTAPFYCWPDQRYNSYPLYGNVLGICLIGNVNHHPFSAAQIHCLAELTRALQRRLNIPASAVKFQWDYSGMATPAEQRLSTQFQRRLVR